MVMANPIHIASDWHLISHVCNVCNDIYIYAICIWLQPTLFT